MKILEYMTITEAADLIKEVALDLVDKESISEQEAYTKILQNKEEYLGGK